MERFFDITWLLPWIAATLDLILARIQSVDFILQLISIIGSALAAVWLAPRLSRLAKKLLLPTLSRTWLIGFSHVIASIAVPGLWLLLLWFCVQAGQGVGLSMAFAEAVISLLVAWVVIRLASHVVRNETASRVIFFSAWLLAALDIVGLLGRIETWLANTGFSYGQIHVTGLNLVRGAIWLVVLLWLMALLRSFLERRIVRAQSLTPALQALLIQLMKLILPVLAVLAALPVLGVSLTALTVFGGAIAVGVGLGLQKTAANLISGLALLIGGSIKPGDVIAVKDTAGESVYGKVTSIGARYVSLRTRNGTEHLLPNESFLTNGVENWSHSDKKIRLKIPFGVAYESDLKQVIALALESADAVERVVKSPKPVCLMKGFGDYAVEMELRVWIEDPMEGISNVKSECLIGIWDRCKAAGIQIPVPQQDVRIISMPKDNPAN